MEPFAIADPRYTSPSFHSFEAYGAVGGGVVDDTLAIQAAIDAAVLDNGVAWGASRIYRITNTLVISGPMTLEGSGIAAHYGSIDTATLRVVSVEVPTLSPYLLGTVLLMTTPATDAIQITAMGESVHLRNFGIRFADAIRFADTGHGVRCLPPVNAVDADGTRDFGVYDGLWENVFVWGHDGDHYGFSIINGVLNTYINLRSFGGGGIELYAWTNMTAPGNSVFIHPYIAQFVGTTAHGLYIHHTGGLGNILNLFVRPQVNWLNQLAEFPEGVAIDTSVQHALYLDAGSLYTFMIASDIESLVSGSTNVLDAKPTQLTAGGSLEEAGFTFFDRNTGLTNASGLYTDGRFDLYPRRGDYLFLGDDLENIHIAKGVPYLGTGGLVMTSPNGSRWRLLVANDGSLSTALVVPAYTNPGGAGYRVDLINVTGSDGLWILHGPTSAIPLSVLVDAQYVAVLEPPLNVPVAGEYLRFHFPVEAVLITEAKLYLNAVLADFGVWRWQGSNDGTSWTNIGSTFTLSGVAGANTLTELSGNTTAYSYYQLLGVSGLSSWDAKWTEFEFKVA